MIVLCVYFLKMLCTILVSSSNFDYTTNRWNSHKKTDIPIGVYMNRAHFILKKLTLQPNLRMKTWH